MQQRAERFGVQKQEGTTSQGSNGVGKSGDDNNEAALKRKLRFGGDAKSGANAGANLGEGGEKKKARAERFGLTNESK